MPKEDAVEHLLRGIGAWVESVPDYAMDSPETILVAPLSGETSDETQDPWLLRQVLTIASLGNLGRERIMNMFLAYPSPWSPLQVHYSPEHGSADNEGWAASDTEHRYDNGDGSWSCGYLEPVASGESAGSGRG
ncbi:hypothetical protein C8A01DRAFT_34690 [Parachaetomium inaequale]|uniref:Uncharacterized protein n=1 Tax=Parachaetomium inaequale TaxID=2588326 RepID=A0AAN6PJK6_9PEZI|nr:hypothetical protein C8A01DRAFT_34690 [Parachaetomium inaequale]